MSNQKNIPTSSFSSARQFSKVLIANRGEIAVRVIRTARQLGFRTVAVYSDADIDTPHVKLADQAVRIGPAPVGESYLCIEKIIAACKKSGADAVHPGYGFLSENSAFAQRCEQEGIVFIGPPTAAIELMGSKRLSKIAMLAADVPCVPGYEGEDQSEATLIAESKRIGLPVMVKASAGGGGRGMRLVFEESELAEQIRTARSEATNAFGSGELIIEKAVIRPRHIEIQVFCDHHGNAVYLGERDCSIQRRHQKVVEEAPSPFVDEKLRQKMGKAAVQAALACNYVGAGTVEFLVDAEKNFYFLEMNTRLQVEHPVTELITGTDLVAWQLQVAAGAALPLKQEQIQLTGHAMEVRLYAEDPANNFVPQTGKIVHWEPAGGEGIRIDSGISSRQIVSPFYDPMLAKIIAYGATREEARRKLAMAVEDSTLFGIKVNSEFLGNILRHQSFAKGEATTAFISENFAKDSSMQVTKPDPVASALATILLHRNSNRQPFAENFSGWRNSNPAPWPYEIRCDDHVIELALEHEKSNYLVTHNNTTYTINVLQESENTLVFVYNDLRQQCQFYLHDEQVFLRLACRYYLFHDLTHEAAVSEDSAGSGKLVASMDGSIVDVLVQEGDNVRKGQTLAILEAMKMEHPLKADRDGKVASISVKKGDQVRIRQLLVQVESTETPVAEES